MTAAPNLTQVAPAQCPVTVSETVCIQAQVTISPTVEVGDIESFCTGDPVIGECSGAPAPGGVCTFIVSQSICVQVPLTFSATAVATPLGIVCGVPGVGGCTA